MSDSTVKRKRRCPIRSQHSCIHPMCGSSKFVIAVLLGLLGLAQGRLKRNGEGRGLQGDEAFVDVIVGFNDQIDLASLANLVGVRSMSDVKQLNRTGAVAMRVPASELRLLETFPNVTYVEDDEMVYLYGERIPWGIPQIQADSRRIPLPDPTNDCFKVCIVDSGVLARHPDLPYSRSLSNIEGEGFGIPSNEHWDNPVNFHGTHVAGIILAQGGNDIGSVGVIPNNQNMCLMVARSFPDNPDSGALLSSAEEAVEWCADNGARVINMSLGGGTFSTSSQAIMKAVEAEGILVIAAAGNEGGTELKYPASYKEVMSVAAVDSDLVRASFSQTNAAVDITAPGVDVYSTVPAIKVFKNGDTASSEGYEAKFMGYSPITNAPINGEMVDCKKAYVTCPGASGKVCLIERGEISFADKARKCQEAGGIAAIIYNNANNFGFIAGNLGAPETVTIPVVEVDRQSGLALQSGSTVLIDMGQAGYDSYAGTSMAAPYVSGVAAKIWAARPKCTNLQIREALETTAIDLGDTGRDDDYGHGLVQAEAAYLYLMGLASPCGEGQSFQSIEAVPAPAPAPQASYGNLRKVTLPTSKGTYKMGTGRDRSGRRERTLKGSRQSSQKDGQLF